AARAAKPRLIWVFVIRFLNGDLGRTVFWVSGFWFLVSGISDFKSQIANLRFQISDFKSQISNHYCPVKSQIESVGYDCYMDYLDRQGSQIGLKWAFFQKATGSRLAK